MASLTITMRILEALGCSIVRWIDDELADRLSMRPWQTINQVCRRLRYFLTLRGAADTSEEVFHNHERLAEHPPPAGTLRVPALRTCRNP